MMIFVLYAQDFAISKAANTMNDMCVWVYRVDIHVSFSFTFLKNLTFGIVCQDFMSLSWYATEKCHQPLSLICFSIFTLDVSKIWLKLWIIAVNFYCNPIDNKFNHFPLANAAENFNNRIIKLKAIIEYEIWMNNWQWIIDQFMLLVQATP